MSYSLMSSIICSVPAADVINKGASDAGLLGCAGPFLARRETQQPIVSGVCTEMFRVQLEDDGDLFDDETGESRP